MPTLYHHPFCAHSRFIRLVLAEHGIETGLIEERIHERRHDFLVLDPAGQTPVLVENDAFVVPGWGPIAEYLDETRGAALGLHRLLPESPVARVETRRLQNWFNSKFFSEVTNHLVTEKIFKRHMTAGQGGGALNMDAVRAARHNVGYHLHYIGYLLAGRNWLAGDQITLADLAAAAQLSCADYLGDVPWHEDEGARLWYARMKSRPSFRSLLADRLPGLPPAAGYGNLDF